jgi:hypothetical protein
MCYSSGDIKGIQASWNATSSQSGGDDSSLCKVNDFRNHAG